MRASEFITEATETFLVTKYGSMENALKAYINSNDVFSDEAKSKLDDYALSRLGTDHVAETTTSGGIATVVGGLAPAITRNASIYGPDKKSSRKKKKTAKYANSKD